MIYLITGLPGDGKTNYAVGLVKARAEKEKRTVYYNAAPDNDPEKGGMVILDPVALPWKPIDPKEWYTAPEGSIIFIDECQHVFEPRKRGDTQPEFAKRLENHRKAGHDVYLITQHPSFIDAHERKLVEEHTHTVRKFGTSWITRYTWKGYRDQPQLPAARKDAKSESQHLLDKRAFGWYLSTKLDTAKVRVPFKFVLLVTLIVTIPLLSWWWWHRQTERFAPKPVEVGQGQMASVSSSDGGGRAKVKTAQEWVAEQQPRVRGMAYSAPVFDEVTRPVVAPYPAACVSKDVYVDGVVSGADCRCYSQQATRLDVPADMCKGIVAGGFFVAWNQPLVQAVPVRPGAGSQAQQSPAGAGAGAGSFEAPRAAVPAAEEAVSDGGARGKWLPRLPQPAGRPS